MDWSGGAGVVTVFVSGACGGSDGTFFTTEDVFKHKITGYVYYLHHPYIDSEG